MEVAPHATIDTRHTHDQDGAVRQVLSIYRYPWPLLIGPDLTAELELEPRSVLVVARGGY